MSTAPWSKLVLPRLHIVKLFPSARDFNYTHKKQTGGSGQFGRVAGYMEPMEEGEYEFVDKIVGGVIPREFITSCDKGFTKSMEKGSLCGAPITGVRCVINDGAFHAVDSSDIAFQLASMGAFKEGYLKAKPIIMEPIMKVAVEGPSEFQGSVNGFHQSTARNDYRYNRGRQLLSRRGGGPALRNVRLLYRLRSLTQGKAEFTMEFATFKPVPKSCE